MSVPTFEASSPYEGLTAVLLLYKSMLETETADGMSLEDVKTVIIGDRDLHTWEPPALILFGGSAQPSTQPQDDISMGGTSTWEMPITITAIYPTEDPREGWEQSLRIAGTAAQTLLKQRLELPVGFEYVQDVRWTQMIPPQQLSQPVTHYQCHNVITPRIRTQEFLTP